MCICGPAEAKELLQHHEQIRVATKYPRIAKDYFYNKKHQTVEIIKLNGSIELAPIVGLSEVICDIVETGSTLRENGLVGLRGGLPAVCPYGGKPGQHEDGERTYYKTDHRLKAGIKGELKERKFDLI